VSRRVLVVSRFEPFEERPQPLQVMSTVAGLAAGGASVTLVMDSRGRGGRERVEEHLGRPLGESVDLHLVCGDHPGVRGLRRRLLMMKLLRRPWDMVLSRDFRLTALADRLRRRGTPLIHEWHAIPSALGQGREGEDRAARAADAHAFVSEGLMEFAVSRFGIDRDVCAVVPNGCWVDADLATRGIDGLPTARRVLTAGLFRQPSDAEVLAGIARGLGDDLELVVAGAAPAALEALDDVTLLGTLPPAAVPDLLPGCLCQLALYRDDLNTQHFACPLKVVAALASGVPLVATDLPTVRALVRHEHSALLVPTGDAGAVLSALRRLALDRGLARALAENALQLASGFTWEGRGDGLLGLASKR
jgi:glycosyltransferase involved in cell wall biosynthesis